jgi:Xaa-Pro dipeptidase
MLANLPRLLELMKHERIDAVIGTTPESVTYLSGYWAMSQWLRRGPQAYVLIPGDGRNGAIVTNSGLLDLIPDQEDIWIEDIRRYGFFKVETLEGARLDGPDTYQRKLFDSQAYKGPVEALVAAMKERGIVRGRIGIDELGITPQCMEQLAAEMPDITFVRCFAMLEKVRSIKTPQEIERLRRAARIAEMSIDAALALTKEGVTEREMLRAFNGCHVANDALPVTGCIGFGNRSAMINVQPSDRKLVRGDLIRFDVGGRYKHYRSDISRIASFGEPSAKVLKYYKALEKGVLRAYDILKPGLQVTALYEQVMETVRREGLAHYERSHVGHGIGIDGYDPPNIAGNFPGTFEENMVVCVETPYYELGLGGLQVEDMMRVTKDGVESLMTLGTGLRIV